MAKRMAEQMELFEPVTRGFEEGGLMDEGGTVDPVSGNEVPPGSTQEEVRDDIPAQLSEGEFVFPADVVRYIGLEKLMRMRQQAKMGLKRMEEMGQMGNSEEATMPDDLPFSIEDLDMEDEEEYNNTQEFSRGGVVYAQQGTFVNPDPQSGVYYQPPAPTTTGVAEAPMVAASAPANPMGGYKPPQQAFTPVRLPQQLTPTFQGTVGFGPEGVEYETVTYVNEAGQTLILKKNKQTGQLLDLAGNPASIPEGYKLKGEEEKEEVAPVTTQTTQVTQQGDGGGRDDDVTPGATVALGGQSGTGSQKGLRVGDFGVFGVSYDIPGASGLGGITGMVSNIAGLSKNGLPNGATATFFDRTDPSISVVVTAQDFNAIKNSGYKGELAENYKQALDSLAAIKQGKLEESNYNNLTGLSKDLVQRASVKGLMDKVDIENPQGIVDSLKNFGTGTFSQAVDKLNAAERAVLDDMGVDLDLSTKFDEPDFEATPSAIAEVAARQKTDTAMANREKAAEKAAKDAAAAAARAAALDAEDRDNGRDDGGFSGSEGFGRGDGAAAPICLTEDMKVKLNGVVDFVTNVKVGDIVDNTVVTEVLHKHMREGYYVVNGELKITNDHPVLANGSWKRTEDLVLGDYINNVEVTSLEYVDQVTPTVYIGTADDRYDVYTEGEVYTVHGQYKNGIKKAA